MSLPLQKFQVEQSTSSFLVSICVGLGAVALIRSLWMAGYIPIAEKYITAVYVYIGIIVFLVVAFKYIRKETSDTLSILQGEGNWGKKEGVVTEITVNRGSILNTTAINYMFTATVTTKDDQGRLIKLKSYRNCDIRKLPREIASKIGNPKLLSMGIGRLSSHTMEVLLQEVASDCFVGKKVRVYFDPTHKKLPVTDAFV